jgi:AcrR family transcriptional regulator
VAIAEAAGMTHANVYRYFPSKEALIDAVVDAWIKSVETRLTDIADGPDPSDDKLERMVLALARARTAMPFRQSRSLCSLP